MHVVSTRSFPTAFLSRRRASPARKREKLATGGGSLCGGGEGGLERPRAKGCCGGARSVEYASVEVDSSVAPRGPQRTRRMTAEGYSFAMRGLRIGGAELRS